MLTDDDLTRQLATAYRDTTADIEYAGRVPTPAHIPWAAISTLAAAAVVAAGGLALQGGGVGESAPRSSATPGSSGGATSSSASATPQLLTRTITVAGVKMTYQQRDGEPEVLTVLTSPGELPARATPVPLDGPVKAWVGVDPASGDNALYVQAPTRNGGRLLAVVASSWTQGQLVDLLHDGAKPGTTDDRVDDGTPRVELNLEESQGKG